MLLLKLNPTINGGMLSLSEISISSENAVEISNTPPNPVEIPGMSAGLSFGAFDPSGTLEVLYDFEGPVAGFQFDITGLALNGASGGSAGNARFSYNGGTTVIGFSLQEKQFQVVAVY